MSSSNRESAKEPEWQRLYADAVLELDRAALPNRVQAAKTAIHSRIVELKTSPGVDDQSRLEDALKILDWLSKMYD